MHIILSYKIFLIQIALTLFYAILSQVVKSFFIDTNVINYIWIASGFALVALLIGGNKFFPSIFFGALFGNWIQGTTLTFSLINALYHTLGILFIVLLLKWEGKFDSTLQKPSDFMRIFLLAFITGLLFACITQLHAWLMPLSMITNLAVCDFNQCWMGYTLSIIIIMPLLLLWHRFPIQFMKSSIIGEGILIGSLSFLVGQVVFVDWFQDSFGRNKSDSWMFLFITLGAVRLGKHGTILLVTIMAIQGLIGAQLETSFFSNDIAKTKLTNYFFNMLTLSVVGMTLAAYNSERKVIEIEREEILSRLEKIASRVPGLVYQFRQHPDGSSCLPFASEAIRDIYRISPNDVKEDASILLSIVHPDDLPGLLASVQKSARDLSPWNYEYRIKFQDEPETWLLGNAIPEREIDGSILWHGFITDITERKQMEKAVRDNELRYRTVADFTSDWEYWVMPDGSFQYISPSCKQISGYSQYEFHTDPELLMKIIHPDDINLLIGHTHRLTPQGFPEPIDFRILTKNGEYRWISHICRPVYDYTGQSMGLRASNRDITERKLLEQKLKEISIRDPLTNIYNRRHIFERLGEFFSEYLRNENPFTILLIDLDHFKNINDTYGHPAGDFILVEFVNSIKASLRSYDLLGRYGGEEFIIVFKNTKREQIKDHTESLQKIVRNSVYVYKDSSIKITFSAGLSDCSEFDKGKLSVDEIIERADKRLYEAKRTGRDKVVIN